MGQWQSVFTFSFWCFIFFAVADHSGGEGFFEKCAQAGSSVRIRFDVDL
jgi:hypothetical protein